MDTRDIRPARPAVDPDDIGRNPLHHPTLGDLINRRLGRRGLMRGALAVTALSAASSPLALVAGRRAEAASAGAASAEASRFAFEEIEHGVDETHHVARGYRADVLIRWGDPVVPGAPAFDPMNQTAEAQERQFGYNNDYVGFVGLPFGEPEPGHGLLCVNHEYVSTEVMFPNLTLNEEGAVDLSTLTPEQVEIAMAAHGGSIVEIRQDGGRWQVVPDSRYNRRITARSTGMRLSGPAAGHDRLKTSADPSGTTVIGTINNCAGGVTPWGTYLMAEENFNNYFAGEMAEDHPEAANFARLGIPADAYGWARFHDRFDVAKEPNEANRFGWVVEVDPLDPASTPVKRTALGRFKHEGAESLVNGDGRLVVYCGDDERFEHVYKFVSDATVDTSDREANRDLLDRGTLYVARFDEDGSMEWLPLVHGTAPITAENGFAGQADVLIETRRAAELVGATPMDRPEDIEPNRVTGKVYVNLTNNSRREPGQVDAANPRPESEYGHVLEMIPAGGDHTATAGRWEIVVLCGDPADPAVAARWNPATSPNGWFAAPDNLSADSQGRVWIATDQGANWAKSGTADGIWGLETEGELRGTGRMFFRVPLGAEQCGPLMLPDLRTMFVAVQHPAVDGVENYPAFGRKSTFEEPATRWPDFQDGMPPRPSVLVISREDGGPIGEA